jgi:hypothetical protein
MPFQAKDRGLALVLRTVKQHRHLSVWRAWWLALFAVYYALFALPWWTLVLGTHRSAADGFLSWLFLRPVLADPFWVAVQLAHLALVVYASWGEIELPANAEGAAILLYPVYLTLAPAFFLYGRWYSSRAILSEVARLHQLRQEKSN